MDFSEMQAQQKLGSLVYRGSRGSLKRIESNISQSSSLSSVNRRGPSALGPDLDVIGSWRQQSSIARSQESLNSLRTSYSQLGKASHNRSSFADNTSCDTSLGEGAEVPSFFLKFLFFAVTVLQVDAVIDTAVSLLRRNIHHVPFLMYFKFIQVLVKKGKGSTDSLSGMTYCSSSDDDYAEDNHNDLTASQSFEIHDAITEITTYDEVATPAAIVNVVASDNDHDDYGFFADFEEEVPAHTDIHVDPFQSLGRSRSSVMTALCTLEETEEEEE